MSFENTWVSNQAVFDYRELAKTLTDVALWAAEAGSDPVMRLVRGRWFTEADTMAIVPVALVNETMARTYWTDPAAVVGGRIRLGSAIARPWATVVGIVADERHSGVTAIIREKFFIPHIQWPVATNGGDPIRRVFVVARTTGDPLSVAGAARAGDAAPDRVPARGVCRDRPGAGGGGHLRRPGVSGVAANAGDRRAAGPGAPIGRRCWAWSCGTGSR